MAKNEAAYDVNDPDNPLYNTAEYFAYCEAQLAEMDPLALLYEDYPGQHVGRCDGDAEAL